MEEPGWVRLNDRLEPLCQCPYISAHQKHSRAFNNTQAQTSSRETWWDRDEAHKSALLGSHVCPVQMVSDHIQHTFLYALSYLDEIRQSQATFLNKFYHAEHIP